MGKKKQNENINTGLSQISPEFKSAVSVDCVIFGYDQDDLKILMLKSDMTPFEGMYSLLGDLVKPDETTDESAIRILEKHTGLSDIFVEQVSAFSKVDRHPLGRVITIAYYSLIQIDKRLINLEKENPDLKWTPVTQVENLAFDHVTIFEECLKQLRLKLRNQPIGFNLLPSKFSLKQLQNLYEKVLDIKFDKRNFRRKLKALDVLIDINENQSDVKHRPAKLYKFDKEKYDAKKSNGFNFGIA